MQNYIIKRLFYMVPTLLGIMLINFLIVQAAPGGPVEQMIARLQGHQMNDLSRITHSSTNSELSRSNVSSAESKYRGAQGLDPDLIREIEVMYGFDQPMHKRFFNMLGNYLKFDFGDSFFKDRSVIELIAEKLPVSVSLGLWSTLLVYLISIPLGIRKAIKHGSYFDRITSFIIISAYAIPGFLLAILLIVFFAGGSYWNLFPLRGLVSDNFSELNIIGKIIDYFWHLALPITALTIGSFATLTMLTKNSFLDEINKQYVITAKAKGLSERSILYRHVFRNAMLIIISGFPTALMGIFLTGSLLIEVIFSLDGLGLLAYEAALGRDYPVLFGTLYIYTLLGLILKLISDLTYVLVDPRIDFEART